MVFLTPRCKLPVIEHPFLAALCAARQIFAAQACEVWGRKSAVYDILLDAKVLTPQSRPPAFTSRTEDWGGMPVVIDEWMPADIIDLRDRHGRLLTRLSHRNSGVWRISKQNLVGDRRVFVPPEDLSE